MKVFRIVLLTAYYGLCVYSTYKSIKVIRDLFGGGASRRVKARRRTDEEIRMMKGEYQIV